jgi:hypothetical protein
MNVKFRRGFLCLASLIGVAIMILGCDRQKSAPENWQAGGLYSTREENGQFSVVKILVLEPEAVHVRIYKQTFSARPTSVDPASLTLGAYDKEGFSIGHLPLSRRTFALSDPVFISQQSVSDNELEGYRMWKESSGKTF